MMDNFRSAHSGVVECRPPGSAWRAQRFVGLADGLSRRGRPATSIAISDPVAPCAAVVEASGDLPILVVARDAYVHTWQTSVIDALVLARPDAVVVVELGWPGPRPAGVVSYVVPHGAARSSALAVIDRLDAPILEAREP